MLLEQIEKLNEAINDLDALRALAIDFEFLDKIESIDALRASFDEERQLLIDFEIAEREFFEGGPSSPIVVALQQGRAIKDIFTLWGHVKNFVRSIF